MKCPSCCAGDSKVLESRMIEDRAVTRRRRFCSNCDFRFTTYERFEVIPLIVIKKNGERDLFNREKLLHGLQYACRKRPILLSELEKLVAETETSMINRGKPYEVKSEEIGEFVIKRLKSIDEIAYIRFVSVYRQFTDIHSFINEITHLQSIKQKGVGYE